MPKNVSTHNQRKRKMREKFFQRKINKRIFLLSKRLKELERPLSNMKQQSRTDCQIAQRDLMLNRFCVTMSNSRAGNKKDSSHLVAITDLKDIRAVCFSTSSFGWCETDNEGREKSGDQNKDHLSPHFKITIIDCWHLTFAIPMYKRLLKGSCFMTTNDIDLWTIKSEARSRFDPLKTTTTWVTSKFYGFWWQLSKFCWFVVQRKNKNAMIEILWALLPLNWISIRQSTWFVANVCHYTRLGTLYAQKPVLAALTELFRQARKAVIGILIRLHCHMRPLLKLRFISLVNGKFHDIQTSRMWRNANN